MNFGSKAPMNGSNSLQLCYILLDVTHALHHRLPSTYIVLKAKDSHCTIHYFDKNYMD